MSEEQSTETSENEKQDEEKPEKSFKAIPIIYTTSADEIKDECEYKFYITAI